MNSMWLKQADFRGLYQLRNNSSNDEQRQPCQTASPTRNVKKRKRGRIEFESGDLGLDLI